MLRENSIKSGQWHHVPENGQVVAEAAGDDEQVPDGMIKGNTVEGIEKDAEGVAQSPSALFQNMILFFLRVNHTESTFQKSGFNF